MSLARNILDRTINGPDVNLDKVSKALEQVSCGTRCAIIFAHKLARRPQARVLARKQISRTVEDKIRRATADEHEPAALETEFLDQLDSPGLGDGTGARSIPGIITEIPA